MYKETCTIRILSAGAILPAAHLFLTPGATQGALKSSAGQRGCPALCRRRDHKPRAMPVPKSVEGTAAARKLRAHCWAIPAGPLTTTWVKRFYYCLAPDPQPPRCSRVGTSTLWGIGAGHAGQSSTTPSHLTPDASTAPPGRNRSDGAPRSSGTN